MNTIALPATASKAPVDTQATASGSERLLWLDVARLLAAMMVLCIHWLRASFRVGSFSVGSDNPVSIVMDTQEHVGSLALFHYLFIDGMQPSIATWLTNLIGIFGEFGWQAVSAIIVMSGFSLAIAQRNESLSHAQWRSWLCRRVRRILIPYYLIAIPFLTICGLALLVLPRIRSNLAGSLDEKLLSQFHTPVVGVIMSHLIFLDPFAFQWAPDFLAPAWWFVPAILIAYVAYPAIKAASKVGNGVPILILTALISIAAFSFKERHLLINETWYYIILQESFDFSLGIVLARFWLGRQRQTLLSLLCDTRTLILAIVLFFLGNIMNWTPSIRPAAALLYGPALFAIIAYLAMRLEGTWIATTTSKIDAYNLYLVHQPFAFPLALASVAIFRRYATFVGFFLFVATALLASTLVTAAQRRLR